MASQTTSSLGLGIGWRPELALAIERRTDLGFVELLVEELEDPARPPAAVENLRRRGVTVLPHGVSLSLGGAEPPDPARLARLARLAEAVEAPLVSEHLAFVRGGGLESGHLLPVPRDRETLEIVVENVRAAQAALPVPLALENIAAFVDWPNAEFDEWTFFQEILDQTGALLLVDLANIHANGVNRRESPLAALARIPWDKVAYVHVAGGLVRNHLYHDTHGAPVSDAVLQLVEEGAARTDLPGVMLERDDHFPDEASLYGELDAIQAAWDRGTARRIGAESPNVFGNAR